MHSKETDTFVNKITSYEVIDGNDDYVTSYSASLRENTKGKLDGLKLAKEAIKFKSDYKILEVYENGYRKLLEF